MMKATFTAASRVGISLTARAAFMLLCLTGLLGIIAPNARAGAQDQQDLRDQNQADPPSRVARISYIDGSISLQPGGSGDWAAAAKNRPVTIGDKLWSDKDSRLELQAGQASIHIGSMTALSFLNLDQSIIQVRIPEGAINFRVRELREGDLYEVDTPNAAFTVKQAGAFRIDVSENGDGTRVTVFRGEGEVTSGGRTYPVRGGEQAEFNGTDDNVQYSENAAPGPDGLDRWASDRDLREDDSVSAKYVSRDTVGYSDLDDNGTWNEEADYGPVWYPRNVSVGWAPYSDGNWNYVGPWGWTWVGYEPWGFAPYHYGRWNYFGDRWGWCPGVYGGGYPIYGPAFVGFLGGGVGFGFSAGFGFGGGIGWFPLGYGECYHPWYNSSSVYVRNVNINNTHITNINQINNINNTNYAYAHNASAVTVASHNTFVNGQAVNRGAAHVTAASLRGAQVNNNVVKVAPTRQSFTGGANANARVATPSPSVQNRAVVARTAPASAASHMPVRTVNSAGLTPGRTGNAPVNPGANRAASGSLGSHGSVTNSAPANSRQQQPSQNRPTSEMRRVPNSGANNAPQQQPNANRPAARSWEAQGNSTDRGSAPSGFSRPNSPANTPAQQTSRPTRSDRPSWAGSGQPGVNAAANTSRPVYANGNGRSNEPPQRTAPSATDRGYNSQPRTNAPPSRSNSVPSNTDRGYNSQPRSYAPPSRSNSAPSNTARGYNSQPRSYRPPAGYNNAPSRSNQPSQRSAPSYNQSGSQPRTYNAPARTTSAPARSYQPPARPYSAPSRSYEAPARSYSAPSRSYQAPAPSYSAPSHSYSAPSRSYSAPSPSSGGGGGGSRGGGGGGSPHAAAGGGSVSHGHR